MHICKLCKIFALCTVCIPIIYELEATPYPAVIVMQTSASASVPKQLLPITSQAIREARVLMCTVILQDRVSLVEGLSVLILHAVLICKKICSARHCLFVSRHYIK